MRRRSHVPDSYRADRCRSGSHPKIRPAAPRRPRRCTPSAAPTPSADRLPPPGRAGGGGDEFDEEFEQGAFREDRWDDDDDDDMGFEEED